MNLNTLLRHEVFKNGQGDDNTMVDYVAGRLADADEIRSSPQFPYQYLAAYLNAGGRGSAEDQGCAAQGGGDRVRQRAGAAGTGRHRSRYVGLDGVAGHRYRGRGATTKMRCVDVAALFAAAILRRNPDSVVVPFDTQAYDVKIDPSDSILSLASELAKYGGGGTDCSLPLRAANRRYRERKFAGVRAGQRQRELGLRRTTV